MNQIVKNKPYKWWQSLLIVLGVVAFLLLLSRGLNVLQIYIGYASASIALWVVGCVLALLLMYNEVMEYEYDYSSMILRINRVYGKRRRFMTDVILRNVRALGSPEEIKKKYPEAHISKAVRKRCELEQLALAYSSDSEIRVIIIQPNDELKEKIIGFIKK